MRQPKLSIIIPAYNEEKYIGPCLESVKNQTVMPDEVIVVNNNSTDRTASISRKYAFVTLINEKNQGMIPARDAGFNYACGELLGRIDADTVIIKDWVKIVHRAMDNNINDVMGISGPVFLNGIENRAVNRMFSDFHKIGYFKLTKLMLGHETMIGSNMAITRKAWDQVKNEVCQNSQEVHEDIDLSLHISRYGKIFFLSDLKAGISDRVLFENFNKYYWRLKAWNRSVTKHGRFCPPDVKTQ